MKATVKKWGNSLGLRIPKVLSEETGIGENTVVDINIVDGNLKIEALTKELTLEELLEKVNGENIHSEVPHDVKGREEW